MSLFTITPVAIENTIHKTYTEKALDIIGRPINELTQGIIHSLKRQISLEKQARRDMTYSYDEYTALCILDNCDIQCERAFEQAREEARMRKMIQENRNGQYDDFIVPIANMRWRDKND